MEQIYACSFLHLAVVDSVLQGSDNEEAYAKSVKGMIPCWFCIAPARHNAVC